MRDETPLLTPADVERIVGDGMWRPHASALPEPLLRLEDAAWRLAQASSDAAASVGEATQSFARLAALLLPPA
jgi:hypothetical protein